MNRPLRVALALFSISGVASADGAAGEALFQQAKKLLQEKKVAEACEKFSESHRLDPASGTLLNLADCHARLGKTATAWSEFIAAANLGEQQGKKVHVEEGRKRAKALEASLSTLSIKVPRRVDGMKVFRDDVSIESASIGVPLPVDPGRHEVVVTAPGFKRWSKVLDVKGPGEAAEVEVPALEADPTAAGSVLKAPRDAQPAPTAGAPPTKTSSSTSSGYALLGLGVVGIGVGAYFGIAAAGSYGDAKDACPTRKGCSPNALDAHDRAVKQANFANLGVGLGAVAAGVGLVWILRDGRKGDETAITMAPWAPSATAGASVRGAF